jgi:hypothetical protein
VEYQVVLGKGGRPAGVDHGLEVGITSATFHDVKFITVEGERRPQFD